MMNSDTKSWMHGASERSIRGFLMTAEQITKDNDSLSSNETETLHWCWEGLHHVLSAKLTQAQIEAHQEKNAPPSTEDLMQEVKKLGDKIAAMSNGNGNGSKVLAA